MGSPRNRGVGRGQWEQRPGTQTLHRSKFPLGPLPVSQCTTSSPSPGPKRALGVKGADISPRYRCQPGHVVRRVRTRALPAGTSLGRTPSTTDPLVPHHLGLSTGPAPSARRTRRRGCRARSKRGPESERDRKGKVLRPGLFHSPKEVGAPSTPSDHRHRRDVTAGHHSPPRPSLTRPSTPCTPT